MLPHISEEKIKSQSTGDGNGDDATDNELFDCLKGLLKGPSKLEESAKQSDETRDGSE